MFIAFEGIDGSGKTTQAKRLRAHLRKLDYGVVLVEEPGGTPVGEAIRSILKDAKHEMDALTELLLYEASRSQLVRQIIKPALAKDKIVIADRYALSSLAYQGYGRGLNLKLIEKLNEIATDGLEPDFIFLLDIPPREALKRRQGRSLKGLNDRMEQEALSFHERVREGFLKLGSKCKSPKSRVLLIDGMKRPEQIFREVLRALHAGARLKLDL